MPRDTETIAYLTVAIKKNSELMEQLIVDSQRKNIPKSHLILQYADEYVRLILNGEIWKHVSPSGAQLMTHKSVTQLVPQDPDLFTSDLDEEDFDAYGD